MQTIHRTHGQVNLFLDYTRDKTDIFAVKGYSES